MTNSPANADIVLVDLGMVAKVRPCLVLCAKPDRERTVSIVAPLTTEVRGGESEVAFPKPPWPDKLCVVNLSGLAAVERHRIQRHLGPFPPARFEEVKKVMARMFELD
jgi:mRNA interferase MazF